LEATLGQIQWENFTPYLSLLGGVLIGLSSVILMLANGRIAGISGLLGKLFLSESYGYFAWVLWFILGLAIGPLFVNFFFGTIQSDMVASNVGLIISGILVGFGTTLGNGCTSGHGVCGISRFSSRSLFATCTFVFFGGVTVFIVRNII
jgi:uncharacterized membrane protein YedE/YeeE